MSAELLAPLDPEATKSEWRERVAEIEESKFCDVSTNRRRSEWSVCGVRLIWVKSVVLGKRLMGKIGFVPAISIIGFGRVVIS